MSDKDLRSQLEGLFSQIALEPEEEKEEAVVGHLEAEPAEAELIVPEAPPATGVELEQIAEGIPLGTAEKQEAPSMPVSIGKLAPRLTFRRSIRTRLLVLLLSLTTISVLAIAYLNVNSIQRLGQSAQQTSGDALRAQAEEYLRQLTVGDAQRNDLILKRVQHDAENVAQYAAGFFDKPDVFASEAHWQAEDHMFMGPDGQYINGEDDACSVFVPDFVDINDELLTALEVGAYLDLIFPPAYESDPNTVAIYLGTKQETTRYYPNINLGTILPPDFQVTQRPWYTGSTLENNPERKAVWSPVYEDATGKGLMVTAAAPIYTSQDEFVGVVGVDVTLKDITDNVEEARLLGGGYSFLVDDTGRAIALPEQGYRDILGRAPEPDELGTDLSEVKTEFDSVLTRMMAGSTGFDTLTVGEKELFVAYAPLESMGWSLASVVEAQEVLQSVAALQEELETSTRSLMLARVLPFGGGILAAVAGIGLLLANRLVVDPIQKLAAAAQQIGAGQWDAPLPRTGSDEIGVLSQAFATMIGQLRELMGGLEQRVAERTRELERRAVQLATAAEVSHVATSVLDPDELIRQTVDLIRDHFSFYYVGLFLLDETKRWAMLRAGTGEPGRQMLEAGHRLQVGGESMVGWCTANAQARIALDVGEEAVRFDNPLLPETRSEMALPLISRGQVIGALTVQSTEVAAFSDEDISALQTMADHLAVAIDNARLFSEIRASLEETQVIHRQYLREAWEGFISLPEAKSGYRYTEPGLTSPGEAWLPAMTKAVQQGDAVTAVDGGEGVELAVPITLRGQTIGALGLRRDEASGWTEDDVAVVRAAAEHIALTLENRRLFEETRRRARHEQIIREITTKMRRSTDLDTILQTTVQELAKLLGTSRTFVRLGTDLPSTDSEGKRSA
jgi:GAF domain-containing protein/HAMP domain-containing protein